MSIINGRELIYRYSSAQKNAIDNIDIDVEVGELVAILGGDGCGKTTLAKLINGLLLPESGKLKVADVDVDQKMDIRRLREKVGDS